MTDKSKTPAEAGVSRDSFADLSLLYLIPLTTQAQFLITTYNVRPEVVALIAVLDSEGTTMPDPNILISAAQRAEVAFAVYRAAVLAMTHDPVLRGDPRWIRICEACFQVFSAAFEEAPA